MAEKQRSQGWWQTVPGILTATAGIITAIAGLIAALNQAGVFAKAPTHIEQPPSNITTAPPPTGLPAGPAMGASPPPPSPAGPATQSFRALAAGMEVRVGNAVYRILAAQLDRRNAEALTLRFTVRMTNGERFPTNFWDESFRLRVDGIPTAPVSNPSRSERRPRWRLNWVSMPSISTRCRPWRGQASACGTRRASILESIWRGSSTRL